MSDPGGVPRHARTFYLHIDSAETTTTTAYDKLHRHATGSATLAHATPTSNKASGYALKTFDVSSASPAAPLSLKFTGVEDSSPADRRSSSTTSAVTLS